MFTQNFDVLATGENDVILAFHRGQPTAGPVGILVRVFDHAAGAWGPATVVSPPGIKGGFCGLRRSPDLAHVALKDSPGAGGIFHHRWYGATKTFAPATVVPGSIDVWHDFGLALEELAFAVGNDGSSTISWLRIIGAAETIMGTRNEAEAWGAALAGS